MRRQQHDVGMWLVACRGIRVRAVAYESVPWHTSPCRGIRVRAVTYEFVPWHTSPCRGIRVCGRHRYPHVPYYDSSGPYGATLFYLCTRLEGFCKLVSQIPNPANRNLVFGTRSDRKNFSDGKLLWSEQIRTNYAKPDSGRTGKIFKSRLPPRSLVIFTGFLGFGIWDLGFEKRVA